MIRPVLSDGDEGSHFGTSIAMSTPGDVAAPAGAPMNDEDVAITFPDWDLLPPSSFVDRSRRRPQ